MKGDKVTVYLKSGAAVPFEVTTRGRRLETSDSVPTAYSSYVVNEVTATGKVVRTLTVQTGEVAAVLWEPAT